MSRYIDADALIETLKKRYWHYVRNYGENDEYANCIDDCMEIVLDQPTADVKPVVRGELKENEEGLLVCSVCHEEAITVEVTDYDYDYDGDLIELGYHLESVKTNFCPNCGADMRGVKE